MILPFLIIGQNFEMNCNNRTNDFDLVATINTRYHVEAKLGAEVGGKAILMN